VALSYGFNVPSSPTGAALRVPAKSSQFQLIKITIAQQANAAVIQGHAYSMAKFSDVYQPNNWALFAETTAATVTGGPGSFVPYFSAKKVPPSAGVDNAIYAIKFE
jgi:hypothetical protein